MKFANRVEQHSQMNLSIWRVLIFYTMFANNGWFIMTFANDGRIFYIESANDRRFYIIIANDERKIRCLFLGCIIDIYLCC